MKIFLALALMILVTPLHAQEAPVGNAHPDEQQIEDAQLPTAFGSASQRSTATLEQKLAFAREVDLDALRGLAIFHGGRVKILDTFARETVAMLTGHERFEIVSDGKKQKFDPLFTLLDMTIDPGWYLDKPLIHVSYLPLRRAIIEREMAIPPGASEGDAVEIEAARDRAMKLTRISPAAAIRQLPGIEQEYGFNQPYAQGIAQIRSALRRIDRLGEAYLMVAPESSDAPWHHLQGGGFTRDSEVSGDALALGSAWRAMDSEGVQRAIATLTSTLPQINADQYPTSRRSIELAYNRAHLFTWGYWLYLLATVVLLLGISTHRRTLRVSGTGLLALAIALHATGFLARCLIAERWAIQNQFESMIGISLFGALLAAGLMIGRRNLLYGAAGGMMGFLVLVTATQAQIPGKSIGREAAILNTSVLLKYHVTTVLTSYGLITLGFVLSAFFLVAYYARRLGPGAIGQHDAPSERAGDAQGTGAHAGGPIPAPKAIVGMLRDLDRATMTVLQLAFWTLGVGILLGAWWADHSWGRFWAFDPKETWALATWIIYLIVIHVRPVAKNRELATAWLSVLGFIVMLWTYFGVNLLLPGLHSYA